MDAIQKPVLLIPLFWYPVPLIVFSVYGHCSKVLVLDLMYLRVVFLEVFVLLPKCLVLSLWKVLAVLYTHLL